MEVEILFESTKVSTENYNHYETKLEEKVNEIKNEIISILNERYSIQIDIKNNCIINSKVNGESRE